MFEITLRAKLDTDGLPFHIADVLKLAKHGDADAKRCIAELMAEADELMVEWDSTGA